MRDLKVFREFRFDVAGDTPPYSNMYGGGFQVDVVVRIDRHGAFGRLISRTDIERCIQEISINPAHRRFHNIVDPKALSQEKIAFEIWGRLASNLPELCRVTVRWASEAHDEAITIAGQ